MREFIKRQLAKRGWRLELVGALPPAYIADDEVRETINLARHYTMTPMERLVATCEAARYVRDHNIEGAVVECGVWKGGSMMAMAMLLRDNGRNPSPPHVYLFDTFEGMTEPTAADVRYDGKPASEVYAEHATEDGGTDWVRADVGEVAHVMERLAQYPTELTHIIPGRVEDTIPDQAPDRIALLRLDTDLYESTRHELEHLFDRIVPGGVLIIDDYGYWQGSRKAVDEFIADRSLRLFLAPTGSGRIAVVP